MQTIDLQPMSLISLDFACPASLAGGMDTQAHIHMRDHLTTTQGGRISEQIVASQLMLASSGRLAPYWPLADDHGVDFMVRNKATGQVHELQVKACFATRGGHGGTVQFDTRERTFNGMSGGFILAAMIDPADGAFWRGWLIPVSELIQIARLKRGYLVITPNPSAQSQDRYATWRCTSMADVVARLEASGGATTQS